MTEFVPNWTRDRVICSRVRALKDIGRAAEFRWEETRRYRRSGVYNANNASNVECKSSFSSERMSYNQRSGSRCREGRQARLSGEAVQEHCLHRRLATLSLPVSQLHQLL